MLHYITEIKLITVHSYDAMINKRDCVSSIHLVTNRDIVCYRAVLNVSPQLHCNIAQLVQWFASFCCCPASISWR